MQLVQMQWKMGLSYMDDVLEMMVKFWVAYGSKTRVNSIFTSTSKTSWRSSFGWYMDDVLEMDQSEEKQMETLRDIPLWVLAKYDIHALNIILSYDWRMVD